jgi:hypothetical protein
MESPWRAREKHLPFHRAGARVRQLLQCRQRPLRVLAVEAPSPSLEVDLAHPEVRVSFHHLVEEELALRRVSRAEARLGHDEECARVVIARLYVRLHQRERLGVVLALDEQGRQLQACAPIVRIRRELSPERRRPHPPPREPERIGEDPQRETVGDPPDDEDDQCREDRVAGERREYDPLEPLSHSSASLH